jgi:hypothetical protein
MHFCHQWIELTVLVPVDTEVMVLLPEVIVVVPTN